MRPSAPAAASRSAPAAQSVGHAQIPVVDRVRIARQADAGHAAAGPGAGPVIPEDVVEQQRVAEDRRAGRQRGLQQGAVARGGQPAGAGWPLLVMAVAVVMFFMIVLL